MSHDPTVAPRCKQHPREKAGWYCDACKRALCGGCTATEVGRFFCSHCDGVARQFTVPRSSIPFSTLLLVALAQPFRRAATLVVVAVFMAGLASVPTWLETLGVTKPVAAAVAPVDTATPTATPPPPPPPPATPPPSDAPAPDDLAWVPAVVTGAALLRLSLLLVVLMVGVFARVHGADSPLHVLLRLVYAWLASTIVWLPGVAYLVFVHRGWPSAALLGDWIVRLYVALALVYEPILVVLVAGGAKLLQVLNPFTLAECAWRVRGRYVVTLLGLLGFAVAGFAFETQAVERIAEVAPFRFLVNLAVDAFLLLLVMQAAHLLGSLGFVYGHELGWGHAVDYREPLLPGVRATGTLKQWRTRLDDLASAGTGSTLAEEGRAKEIAEAVKRNNAARALKLYEMRPNWGAEAFEPGTLLGLANAAVVAKKVALAESLFGKLVDRKDLSGARALFGLAKLHEAKNDKVKAFELYKLVVERFPQSDVAKMASQRLAAGLS
jgi:hypothetical protein